jgi:hypothetical protein
MWPTSAESPRLSIPGRGSRWLPEGLLLLGAMLSAGAISALLFRQDANWDLRNYHFYNAWAFVHDRLGWDLAPAQMQTFLNPLLDLPFYWMVAAGWHPRLIAFVLALPAGVGVFFLARILFLLFPTRSGTANRAYAALAFVTGVTASGSVSLLGSTMNDWPGTALIMIALWLLLDRDRRDVAGWHSLAAAGLVAGIASGLKWTNAPYALGLCAALLLTGPSRAHNLRNAFAFSVAVVAGVLLSSLAWMWTLYTKFDSPMFPFFNDIFRSPWWDATRLADLRFRPRTLAGWLTFPLNYRDLRLPLLYVGLIYAGVAWHVRRWRRMPAPAPADPAGPWRFVLVFGAVSFIIWAAMFTVYRYLLPLQLLSGALLIHIVRINVPRGWLPAAATLTAALAIFTVHYPDLGRVDYGRQYFTVSVPPVAPHAAVLLVSDQPMAFVLPFLPADGRFLGANNNLIRPHMDNKLAVEIARIVDSHDGPLYALSYPPGDAASVLDAYRLRRAEGGCAPIVSNMSPSSPELCRLERIAERHQPDEPRRP